MFVRDPRERIQATARSASKDDPFHGREVIALERDTRRALSFTVVPPRFSRLETIPDVMLIEPQVWRDQRGWFVEAYRASDYAAAGIVTDLVQENQSFSASRFVLRGLHFQIEPKAQAKLVRCLEGRIFDVVVDLRRGSPTYARYASTILNADEPRLVWVPSGFAHGFLTLSARASVVYQQTAEYSPRHERAIRWNDPQLAIPWPLEGASPLMSRKDAEAPFLAEVEDQFVWSKPGV